MSRGIFEALDKIKTMIEAIDPKTDSHHGFICIDDGSGLVSPLNTRFHYRLASEKGSIYLNKA